MVKIDPGLITVDAAAKLNAFLKQTAANKEVLARKSQNIKDYFPAQITGSAFDTTVNQWAYAWTERTFDANGKRAVHPSPSTGTTTFNVAYAVGDGTRLLTFPEEVYLRKRNVTRTRGVALEFPLYCACPGGGGGGGGFVDVTCCPVPVPACWLATISAPGCLCGFDGFTFNLFATPPPPFPTFQWEGCFGNYPSQPGETPYPPSCSDSTDIQICLSVGCFGSTFLITGLATSNFVGNGTTACGLIYDVAGELPTFVQCDPFMLQFSGHLRNLQQFGTTNPPTPPLTCPCDGTPFTITMTGC